MTECNCHQTAWYIAGPIPSCPTHDLCGKRGCGCGRQPCGFRPYLHAVQEALYGDKTLREGVEESVKKPHPFLRWFGQK